MPAQVYPHRQASGAPPKQQQQPAYSLASLIRSRLKDPQLEVQPGEGAAEARVSDTLMHSIPEHLRVRGAVALPYSVTGYDSGAGNLSPTQLALGAVIRPELSIERLGGRRITLPDGWYSRSTVSASRISSGWSNPLTGEVTQVQTFTLGATSANPRESSTVVELSRLLLRQSGAEALVRELFSVATSTEFERATIAGTGRDGQPLGLLTLGLSGVLPVSPVAGAMPTTTELATAMQATLDRGARLRQTGWLLSLSDWDSYMELERRPGIPALVERDGGWSLLGRPAEFSMHVPTGKAICGEFSEVELTWEGVPQMLVDPFTRVDKRITKISLFDYFDATVRRPSLLTLIGAES